MRNRVFHIVATLSVAMPVRSAASHLLCCDFRPYRSLLVTVGAS